MRYAGRAAGRPRANVTLKLDVFGEGDGSASGTWTKGCTAISMYVAPYDLEIMGLRTSSANGDAGQEFRGVFYSDDGTTAFPQPKHLLGKTVDLVSGMPTGLVTQLCENPIFVPKGTTIYAGGQGDVGSYSVTYNEGFGINPLWYNAFNYLGPTDPAPAIENLSNPESPDTGYKTHKWGMDLITRSVSLDVVYGNISLQRQQLAMPASGEVVCQSITFATALHLNGFFHHTDSLAAAAKWQVVVYADSSGTPGALLYTSPEFTGRKSGWNYQPIDFQLPSPGAFWIGAISDTADTTSYGRTDEGVMATFAATYPTPASDGSGATLTTNRFCPLFVTGQ